MENPNEQPVQNISEIVVGGSYIYRVNGIPFEFTSTSELREIKRVDRLKHTYKLDTIDCNGVCDNIQIIDTNTSKCIWVKHVANGRGRVGILCTPNIETPVFK